MTSSTFHESTIYNLKYDRFNGELVPVDVGGGCVVEVVKNNPVWG